MSIIPRVAALTLIASAFALPGTVASAQQHDCAFQTSVGPFGIAAGEGVSLRPEGKDGAPLKSINGWPMTVYFEPQQQPLDVLSVVTAEGVTAGVQMGPDSFAERSGSAEFNAQGKAVSGFYCVKY